jgi:hypothetical protein
VFFAPEGQGAGIVGQLIGFADGLIQLPWTHAGIKERYIVGVGAALIFRSKEEGRLAWSSDEVSTSKLLMIQSLKYAAMVETFYKRENWP